MIYCDMGWQGLCNGYFVSGVFNLRDDRIEFDNFTDSGKKVDYDNYVHIIMYDKPI